MRPANATCGAFLTRCTGCFEFQVTALRKPVLRTNRRKFLSTAHAITDTAEKQICFLDADNYAFWLCRDAFDACEKIISRRFYSAREKSLRKIKVSVSNVRY